MKQVGKLMDSSICHHELDEIDVTKTVSLSMQNDTVSGDEMNTFEPILSTNGSILAVRIPGAERADATFER